MPIFELQTPDGKTFEVDAPDMETAAAALDGGEQTPNADAKADRSMSGGEIAADVAKSGGVGLAKGAIGMAGMFGDARELTDSVVRWGAEKLGASPETAESAVKISRLANPLSAFAPTSSDIQGTVEGVTGKFYEPKSTAGEYAQTIGEFAPAAATGPGGIVRKAVMAVVPGAASEALGQATEGTNYEPLARAAGGLAGGLAAAGKAPKAAQIIAKDGPSREAVASATDAKFQQLRDAGIAYDTNAFQNMATLLMSKLSHGGFRAKQAPYSADAVEHIAENLSKPMDFNTFASIRENVSGILREKAATDKDKKAAGIILDALDDFADQSPLITNGSLPADQVAPLMKEARQLARRNILAKQVEDMFAKAETYQSGFESGLRNQFSNYLRSHKAKGLSKEERAAFMDVAHGRKNLERFGKLGLDLTKLGSKASLIPTLVGGSAYAGGDLVTGLGIVGAATAARFAANKGTQNAAKRAESVILSGRDAQKAASQKRNSEQIAAFIRRVLAGETAVRQSLPAKPEAGQ
jgi:hypothetical protein